MVHDTTIIRFMKDVFLAKKPKPKYISTWDVSRVFSYLKSLYPLENLDLKTLTLKNDSFIALATAQRVQLLFHGELIKWLIIVNTLCSLFMSYDLKKPQNKVM